MNLMSKWLTPKTEGGKAEEPQAKYIKKSNIRVEFVKHELTNEEDVEAYMEAVKEACLAATANRPLHL